MLENFRAQKIVWDWANNQIYDLVEASGGDTNGRKLDVTILNGSTVENLTGGVLSLAWHYGEHQGLDAFTEIDATKGKYEIYYTTGMLSNHGTLTASLVLVDVKGRIESKPFDIVVRPGIVDDEAVQSENSFTALTEALVKVSQVQAEFDGLYADKSQMMDTLKVEKSNEMDQLYDDKNQALTGLESDFADKAENLETTYAPRLTSAEQDITTNHQEVTAQLAQIVQEVDITVTVGNDGDYQTINQAINYLSKKNKQNDKKSEIRLLSGFVLREQILVNGQNFGHIKIISDDETVKIENTRFIPNIKLPAYGSYVETNLTAVFGANNYGVLPVIGCLFDMNGSTGVSGVFCVANGGRVKIEKGCGCINAKGGVMLAYQNGSIEAMGAIAAQSTGSAIQAFRDATVLFGGGDASYCQSQSASVVYADVNSTINCDSANLSHSIKTIAQIDQASRATFVGADLSFAGATALSVSYASQVSAKNANLSNANNYGVRAQGASIIDVNGANCIGCDMAITAMTGSLVNASGIDATNYKTSGITSQSGATINLRDAKVQKIQGQNSATDVVVIAGGIVNIDNVLAGSTPNQRNIVTSRGILLDNAFVPDYGSDFGAEVDVPLQSGWTGTLKVSKTSKNIVCLRGDLIAGDLTINKTVALLPTGYRPTTITPLTVINNDNTNRGQFGMHISTSGGIYLSETFKSGAIHLNMMFKI